MNWENQKSKRHIHICLPDGFEVPLTKIMSIRIKAIKMNNNNNNDGDDDTQVNSFDKQS